MGKGRWWCYLYWTGLFPAHGPGVVVKRKGTTTGTRSPWSQGRVHLHIDYHLLRPCSHLLLVRRALFTSRWLSRKYITAWPGESSEKSTMSTKYTPSHSIYSHLPAIRTIIHPRRASYYPLSVVSPASRCAFHGILSCTIGHPNGSGRSEPRAIELSYIYISHG